MTKSKILILGATGRIGPTLIQELVEKYNHDIIIGIHKKPAGKFKSVKTELNNLKKLKFAMKGIDIVINLAGQSNSQASFQELLEPNIIGAYNVFEAAKQSGVKRLIFASSIHAMKGYFPKRKIKHTAAPNSVTLYGITKIFGENLCKFFSENSQMSCLAIRIGSHTTNDMKEEICSTRKEKLSYVVDQSDLAQLIHKCIIATPNIKFAILHGTSANTKNFMDLKFTKKLVGYEPEFDAVKNCKNYSKKTQNQK